MTTLLDVRTDIRSHLDEASARFWDDIEIDRWVHEALRDIARRAEILPEIKSYTVKSQQEAYNLPEDLLRVHRVEYRQTSTNTWALEFRPIMEMDDIWLRSRTISSSSPYWYTIWGHSGGSQQLRPYPIPSETISDGLWIYYYRLPHKPEKEGDQIDIPSGWEDLIPLYVEMVARRKDNDPRWREAFDLYMERLSQMMSVTRHLSDQMTFFSRSPIGMETGDWGYGDGGWE